MENTTDIGSGGFDIREDDNIIESTSAPKGELMVQAQRDAPELVRVLTDIVSGLDEVRNKLDPFLTKVKAGEYATNNGISYLESKHILLMFYCQCIVFYILLKAQGKSVQNHPVVARLIEIRMFLDKIRPIDKKLHYQIEKLLKLATGPSLGATSEQNVGHTDQQDALMYKPNPDMLVSRTEDNVMEKEGIYRPPMIAPAAMNEESSLKNRKSEARAQKEAQRKASRSVLIKDLANELEGKPEEIREYVGSESKEMSREILRLEARAEQEENLFARIPLSKVEKKKMKHLKRSRNGLMGMLDDFDDDISNLLDMDEQNRSRDKLSERSGSERFYQPFHQAGKESWNPKEARKSKWQKNVKRRRFQ